MKTFKLLTQIIVMLITISITAQQGINYKAIVKDGSGNVVANDLIVVQFTILQGVAETNVYQETHTPTTDANGLVILNIGEGTVVSGVFGDIDWGSDTHTLKVEINTGGGLVDMGTTQFKTVPYALSSADNQWLKTGIDIENTNTGNVTVNGSLEVGTTLKLELGTTANEISIDGTLADNSDDAIPTEQAVKTYVDNSNNNTVTKIDDLTDGKSDGSSVFLGEDAGLNDDGTSNFNVGVGFQTLISNISGDVNTAIGTTALVNNTTGSFNTANGAFALFSNTEGNNNTANGYQTLFSNTTGNQNTANGAFALYSNTEGFENTAIGHEALFSNTTGFENTANGSKALFSNTTGYRNTAIGNEALYSNIEGRWNVAIGYQALFSNEGIGGTELPGSWNTAIGYQALYANTEGAGNIAIGISALKSNTTAGSNIAIGTRSLENNNTGDQNVAIGLFALTDNDSGYRNTGIGNYSLFSNTTGNNNTAIGFNAEVPDGTADNQVRIGNTSVTYAGVQVAWDVTSDKRWKENIRELPYGLAVIKQLMPVDYIRKNNNAKTREMGFIAQDVEALLTKIGYTDQGFLHKDDKGYMSLRYNDFIALLTKAIQEQQDIIEKQDNEIRSLKSELAENTKKQEHFNLRLSQLEQRLNTSQQ